jgi:hypothetical protein
MFRDRLIALLASLPISGLSAFCTASKAIMSKRDRDRTPQRRIPTFAALKSEWEVSFCSAGLGRLRVFLFDRFSLRRASGGAPSSRSSKSTSDVRTRSWPVLGRSGVMPRCSQAPQEMELFSCCCARRRTARPPRVAFVLRARRPHSDARPKTHATSKKCPVRGTPSRAPGPPQHRAPPFPKLKPLPRSQKNRGGNVCCSLSLSNVSRP